MFPISPSLCLDGEIGARRLLKDIGQKIRSFDLTAAKK